MGIPAKKLAAVRALVETVPDDAIVGLNRALAGSGGMGAMGSVRDMVRAEAAERQVRNVVLAPVAGLCRGERRVGQLTFSTRVLRRLWSGLKVDEPGLVAEASAVCPRLHPDEPLPPVLDALCAAAGAGLRARSQPDFVAAAEACDATLAAGADAMAGCLDLAPVVRSALPRLDGWIGRMTEERAAVARLAYRDAVDVSPDAGPRFVEMLASRFEEPWQVLRIIAIVMDHPNEGYLASSELAGLALDVFDDIDRQLARAKAFDSTAGVAAGRDAGRAIHQAAQAILEFTDCIEMHREGPWGGRLAGQRALLTRIVETKLALIDGLVAAALPLETVRFAGRMTKEAPRLTLDPDETAVNKALAKLNFADELRAAADIAGFGSLRAKTLEKVNERLAGYTDDLIGHLRAEEGGGSPRARKFLDIAADFLALSKDEKAAQIVRRRAVA